MEIKVIKFSDVKEISYRYKCAVKIHFTWNKTIKSTAEIFIRKIASKCRLQNNWVVKKKDLFHKWLEDYIGFVYTAEKIQLDMQLLSCSFKRLLLLWVGDIESIVEVNILIKREKDGYLRRGAYNIS
jgi:hypothetical protein